MHLKDTLKRDTSRREREAAENIRRLGLVYPLHYLHLAAGPNFDAGKCSPLRTTGGSTGRKPHPVFPNQALSRVKSAIAGRKSSSDARMS